jgi:nuclear pore complex protein Nup54
MIHDFRVFILIFVGQVVQQQTEAIARLGNVLKRDIRDMEIIMAEDTELTD